jgi:hypothetical protein
MGENTGRWFNMSKTMEIAGKDRSLTIDDLIGKLEDFKELYGNIEVYYNYDGMNYNIQNFKHVFGKIEERGIPRDEDGNVDMENGKYPQYLVPEHILIS